MRQSSIDWLYNNLKSHFEHDGDLLEAVKMSFEQAKAMEQEQMIDWYATGQADTVNMYEQHLKKPSNTKEK
jgi:hypothetical protein